MAQRSLRGVRVSSSGTDRRVGSTIFEMWLGGLCSNSRGEENSPRDRSGRHALQSTRKSLLYVSFK